MIQAQRLSFPGGTQARARQTSLGAAGRRVLTLKKGSKSPRTFLDGSGCQVEPNSILNMAHFLEVDLDPPGPSQVQST